MYYAMGIFVISVAATFVLFPEWTTFSRTGTLLRTWPIFATGMFAAAYVLWQFSGFIMETYQLHKTQRLLQMSAAIAIFLVFVPYKAGDLGRIVHNVLALTLALSIFLTSCMIARKKQQLLLWSFVTLQITGLVTGIFCFIYLLQTPSILWGIFEPIFFLGVGGIITSTLRNYR